MIELESDQLVFSFPEVHPDAVLRINFQRTLRLPDDGRTYPLPPGLGRFPIVHVDDYAQNVPERWSDHGGVIIPMFQAEAMWVYFDPQYSQARNASYPFAVKIYTGKINAVTGERFKNGLHDDDQDYLAVPGQPWLDGYCVSKGTIRQFVAAPLGQGFTAEEQITGEAEWGGMQIVVYPMKASEYEARFPVIARKRAEMPGGSWGAASPMMAQMVTGGFLSMEMGLAPGGKMHQEIFEDKFPLKVYDRSERSRCFVHITNSIMWKAVTGKNPPSKPPTAAQYTQYGLPWFDYYDDDLEALSGSPILKSLKSLFSQKHGKNVVRSKRIEDDDEDDYEDDEFPRNRKIVVKKLTKHNLHKTVREGDFWEESV
ncbi:MAG: hypothetical protein K2X77_12910 [Candidatus Obscuribacterales bacterium]|nr:hypothetical protein [Candidatus Obscuribacterales bacterium]